MGAVNRPAFQSAAATDFNKAGGWVGHQSQFASSSHLSKAHMHSWITRRLTSSRRTNSILGVEGLVYALTKHHEIQIWPLFCLRS